MIEAILVIVTLLVFAIEIIIIAMVNKKKENKSRKLKEFPKNICVACGKDTATFNSMICRECEDKLNENVLRKK